MYKKILSLVLICVGFIFCVNFSFAQNETNSNSSDIDEDLIIASVDFEEGVIEDVSANNIKISFNVINNHTKVLADMVYAVQIIGTKEGAVNKVMYEYVYNDDHLTISPKNTIRKTANVPIPGYLDGSFKLRLIGRTVDGITLENYIVGEVQLTKTVDEYINNRGCFAYVNDEQFRIEQGVDIAKDETIILKCDISNMVQKDIAYFSEVSVYDKSLYNIKNALDVSSKEGSIEKNSDKEISLEIPTPKESGYYDATLVFLNRDKKQISNEINMHFVVQGLSGSISDVVFDKNSYNVGEEAKVDFAVFGSADRFPNSRISESDDAYAQKMSVQIDIMSDNKECSDKIKRELASDSIVSDLNEKIKIKRDCHNPIATFILSDENGNVLDKKVLSLLESKGGENETAPAINNNNFVGMDRENMLKIFSILTLILILAIIIVLFKRNSKNNPNKIIIFLFGSALLFMGNSAYAGTLISCGSLVKSGVNTDARCYYDISPASATLGSTFTAEAGMSWGVCKNGELEMIASYNPTTNGAPWTNLVDEEYGVDHCENTSTGYNSSQGRCKPGSSSILGRDNIFGNPCIEDSKCNKDYFDIMVGHDLEGLDSFTPTTAGSKTAYFRFYYYHDTGFNDTFTKSKSYAVTDPIINGACGTNAATYPTSTTAFSGTWCAPGTASANPAFPSYGTTVNWNCVGSGPNHTDAPCSATRDPIVAACGTRNVNYSAATNTWPIADTWCAAGNTASGTPVTFPSHGAYTANWTCAGSTGGGSVNNCRTGSFVPAPAINAFSINGNASASIFINKDLVSDMDMAWEVNKNTASASVETICTKSGTSWGSGQIIPPKGLIDSDNNFPLPSAIPTVNSPYSLSCYNDSTVDDALNSGPVSKTINITLACTERDYDTVCTKSCGSENKQHRHVAANCVDTLLSTPSCNLPPCPASSEWVETKP